MDLFGRKPRVIATFGIHIKESLEELDFDADIIANGPPPWIYPTAMVKDVFQDYDFIYCYR